MPCQINLQNQQNPRPLQDPAVQIQAMIQAVQVAVVPILVSFSVFMFLLYFARFWLKANCNETTIETSQSRCYWWLRRWRSNYFESSYERKVSYKDGLFLGPGCIIVFRELEDGREWRTETCSCFDNTETCLPGIIPCVLGGTIVEASEIQT